MQIEHYDSPPTFYVSYLVNNAPYRPHFHSFLSPFLRKLEICNKEFTRLAGSISRISNFPDLPFWLMNIYIGGRNPFKKLLLEFSLEIKSSCGQLCKVSKWAGKKLWPRPELTFILSPPLAPLVPLEMCEDFPC